MTPLKSFLKKLFAILGILEPVRQIYTLIRSLRFARENIRYYVRGAPDNLPIPPLLLIALVTGKADVSFFFSSGRAAADSICETLLENNLSIKDFDCLLDFGCGCGRVTRYWRDLKNTAIYGTDYNRNLIRWCQSSLTFGRFENNALHPPLNFPGATFSFTYALPFLHISQRIFKISGWPNWQG